MKTIIATLLFIALSTTRSGEPEHAVSFANLDRRAIPGWYEDAKFGIFIHWGAYSVPAWSPKGSYAEWYQFWLDKKKTYGNVAPGAKEVHQYHQETYGADYSYYQFGQDFKAERFDPKAWADLFQTAGAKYIVLTTKHHDGFALWPSKQTERAWSMPWNSMTAGPKKDLVGELKREVNKTDVKFGLYYSLYEWFNPLYLKKDKSEYVRDYMIPQMKDLVNTYKPSILWTDGQWDLSTSEWESKDFVSWLYTSSPIRDSVVINGRWGKDMKPKEGPFLGNFISTENDGVEALDGPWEECRGIGYSFGYNQNEDIRDYNTSQTLILMLIDIVSHGGNLLLDIGPDAHGEIPQVMKDRLTDIGAWLKINGEAIYGSRRWKEPVQWSAGRRTSGVAYKKEKKLAYLGGDFILKQTVNPDPGDAVKEVFFTTKGDVVYAILPTWGRGGKLHLKDFSLNGRKVSLLETGEGVDARQQGTDVEISLPAFDPTRIRSRNAWVLKIS